MKRKFYRDTRFFKTRKEAEKLALFFENVMGRRTKVAQNKNKMYFVRLCIMNED
jgi:hypothetical protein